MAIASLASAGLGSTVAGGALGAAGSMLKGIAGQDMYNYQAGVAEINANIARQNSQYAWQTGEIQAQAYGMKANQQEGQIVSRQAAGGLDVNSGSNARVQQGQKTVAGMDLVQIRSNAAKTAYDYSTQATQYANQAAVDKYAAKNEMMSGVIGVASSIVGSAGSVASKWAQGSQVGLFGASSGPADYTSGNDPLNSWSLGR